MPYPPAEGAGPPQPPRQPLVPPMPPATPVDRVVAGRVRVDECAWLDGADVADDVSGSDPAILAHLDAERRYAEAVLAGAARLRAAVYDEMRSRLAPTDVSVPTVAGGWEYYYRTRRDRPYPVYCRRPVGSGADAEVVYFDPHALAAEVGAFEIGAFSLSGDHRWLAVSYDATGDEEFTLVVVDAATGRLLDDRVPGTFGQVAWAADNASLLHACVDATGRPAAVARHVVGSDSASDLVVFTERDPSFQVSVVAAKTRAFVFITVESHTSSEVWWADAGDPTPRFRVVVPRQPGVIYEVEDAGGCLLATESEAGGSGRVFEIPYDDTARRAWRPVDSGGIDVDFVDVFRRHYLVHGRLDGFETLAIVDRDSRTIRPVEFADAACSITPLPAPEVDSAVAPVLFSSLATPTVAFDVDLATGGLQVRKRADIPEYDAGAYTVERLAATAADGIGVPLSVVYRSDSFAGDGSNPCVLHGYGAYGETLDPDFAPERVSLLDRGFVVALAHVRGGGERGRPWHEAGRRERKGVAVDDFVACAEHLCAAGFTAPGRVAAAGTSAGGLLVGAAVNRRADLFGAVVATVPFLDPIGALLDAEADLDAAEWEEWGDPRDPEQLAALLEFAPYDNVGDHPYPPMLLFAGANDARVPAAHALKFAARVRAHTTSDAPVVVWVEEGGHAGATGRLGSLERQALVVAFLVGVAGLDGPP